MIVRMRRGEGLSCFISQQAVEKMNVAMASCRAALRALLGQHHLHPIEDALIDDGRMLTVINRILVTDPADRSDW